MSDDVDGWAAIGELYHRYLTGLLLALVTRQGTDRAAEVVFPTFRRQHLELFLPGLLELELDQLPHAVACAQYHVLSNALGGVNVVWIPESDTKSWVRYVPPRWIFDGTAVCGIPTEVSRAMLQGWHGHNGVTLGNDRLGFVCTMQTTDGQPGLEGYYIEEDHPLLPEDRVRFRPGERPPNEPVDLPRPSWDPMRLVKVERNYATAYIRSILPELCAVLGPADAGAVGTIAARQIGMHYHATVMGKIGLGGEFVDRFARLLRAHGDDVEVAHTADDVVVRLARSSLLDDLGLPSEAFDAWNGLWEGMAAIEQHRLVLTHRRDAGDANWAWRVLDVTHNAA